MIYFLAPDFTSFISGGNIFNYQIFRALLEIGASIERYDVEKFDRTVNGHDCIIFDSIYLNQMQLELVGNLPCKKIFLCHLLPSMVEYADKMEEGRLLKKFDIIIANSQFTKEYIAQSNDELNIQIIQPFIEKPSFINSYKVNRAVVVANFVRNKNIDTLLKALDRFQSDILPIDIVGNQNMDKDYFSICDSILKKSNYLMGNVRFLDPLPRSDYWALFSKYQVLLDVSCIETYGMAVAEAVSIGLPILSLGNGNVKNLLSTSTICVSIEDMINRLSMRDFGCSDIQKKVIVTDWNEFKESIKTAFFKIFP